MHIEVRYYSRSGNTKLLAESIAKSLNVDAISVDEDNSDIKDVTDILFIGGGLYAYGLDKHLKQYLDNLDGNKIKNAVVFSTSWISKHSIYLIKDSLTQKGIKVEEEYCYAKSKPSDNELKEAEKFAKKVIGEE